jgi:hypothetical protein
LGVIYVTEDMFKSCCGCKNSRTNDNDVDAVGTQTDAYARTAADVKVKKSPVAASDSALPDVTVTEPEDGTVSTSKPETERRHSDRLAPETRGGNARHETAEGKHDEVKRDDPDEDLRAETAEVEAGRRSRLPSDEEVDRETLQAVARGMLATPHPAKRNSGGGVPMLAALPQWVSQEDDDIAAEGGGTAEPPATPVGRDELALRRHRFFSDLLEAHQAGAEHRVHFDPLGPVVAGGEYRRQ